MILNSLVQITSIHCCSVQCRCSLANCILALLLMLEKTCLTTGFLARKPPAKRRFLRVLMESLYLPWVMILSNISTAVGRGFWRASRTFDLFLVGVVILGFPDPDGLSTVPRILKTFKKCWTVLALLKMFSNNRSRNSVAHHLHSGLLRIRRQIFGCHFT